MTAIFLFENDEHGSCWIKPFEVNYDPSELRRIIEEEVCPLEHVDIGDSENFPALATTLDLEVLCLLAAYSDQHGSAALEEILGPSTKGLPPVSAEQWTAILETVQYPPEVAAACSQIRYLSNLLPDEGDASIHLGSSTVKGIQRCAAALRGED